MLTVMFRDVKQTNANGGIEMAIPGLGRRLVLPFILLIAVDHPEGNLAAAVSSAACKTSVSLVMLEPMHISAVSCMSVSHI